MGTNTLLIKSLGIGNSTLVLYSMSVFLNVKSNAMIISIISNSKANSGLLMNSSINSASAFGSSAVFFESQNFIRSHKVLSIFSMLLFNIRFLVLPKIFS